MALLDFAAYFIIVLGILLGLFFVAFGIGAFIRAGSGERDPGDQIVDGPSISESEDARRNA